MVDWKKLFLPSIEKSIGLILIFFITSINTTLDATLIGFPFNYYSCGGKPLAGEYFCNFSILTLILDILLIYLVLCLSFYYKFIKCTKNYSKFKKTFAYLINFVIGLVIFVILFFVFGVIYHDLIKQWMPYLFGFKNTRPSLGF